MKPSKRLQDEWAARLKESGFTDIEAGGQLLPGTQDARMLQRQQHYSEDYYRLAGEYEPKGGFSREEATIWQLHLEGKTVREIYKSTGFSWGNVLKCIHVHSATVRARARYGVTTDTEETECSCGGCSPHD